MAKSGARTGDTVVLGGAPTTAFKATNLRNVFHILREGIYTDKILAVLREYASNAWDAHVEAGIPDTPIKVVLPTALNPELIIRDYGFGLSHEFIFERYIGFGDSTKEAEEGQVGAFGLGSKSAIAYTDAYTVISHHEGVRRTYAMYLDETGIGECSLILEEPTKESGLEVRIACVASDVRAFEEKARYLFRYFHPLPDINLELFDEEKEDTYREFGPVVLNLGRAQDRMVAVVGCVPYRIPDLEGVLIEGSKLLAEREKADTSQLRLRYGPWLAAESEVSRRASREARNADRMLRARTAACMPCSRLQAIYERRSAWKIEVDRRAGELGSAKRREMSSLAESRSFQQSLLNHVHRAGAGAIRVDISDVRVTPSREGLDWSQETASCLAAKVVEAVSAYADEVYGVLDALSAQKRWQEARDYYGSLPKGSPLPPGYTWCGREPLIPVAKTDLWSLKALEITEGGEEKLTGTREVPDVVYLKDGARKRGLSWQAYLPLGARLLTVPRDVDMQDALNDFFVRLAKSRIPGPRVILFSSITPDEAKRSRPKAERPRKTRRVKSPFLKAPRDQRTKLCLEDWEEVDELPEGALWYHINTSYQPNLHYELVGHGATVEVRRAPKVRHGSPTPTLPVWDSGSGLGDMFLKALGEERRSDLYGVRVPKCATPPDYKYEVFTWWGDLLRSPRARVALYQLHQFLRNKAHVCALFLRELKESLEDGHPLRGMLADSLHYREIAGSKAVTEYLWCRVLPRQSGMPPSDLLYGDLHLRYPFLFDGDCSIATFNPAPGVAKPEEVLEYIRQCDLRYEASNNSNGEETK